MATKEEIDAFLAHHGVLGMHWGVRKAESNEEEGRGSRPTGSPRENRGSAAPKATKSSSDPTVDKAKNLTFKTTPKVDRSPEAAKKNLTTTAVNSEYKFQPSDSKNHGLNPKQKKELETAAAVASAGAIIALGVYALKKNPGLLKNIAPGSHVEPDEFKDLVDFTKSQAWGDHESIVKTAFNSQDLKLPAGSNFHRLSSAAEESFGDATYATFKKEDFARYAVGGASNIDRAGYQHVTWDSKEDVHIPSLENALNIFRDTMVDEYKTLSPEQKANRKLMASALTPKDPKEWLSAENIVSRYRQSSGGAWNSELSKSFITNLKAHGYDGLIDENDSAVITESPLVLFSHEKMGPKSSSKITAEDVTNLKANLKELTNRKYEIWHSAEMMEMTEEVDEFLAHFGVKGMHWGERHAKADAHEYVKAKLAIGEGAGNRRKLVNAKVNARASKSPEYKKAFDEHVAKFSEHSDRLARQARVNKNVKATRKSVGKTARGVHRSLTGGFGSVSLASAAIAGAAVYAHKTGLDKQIFDAAKNSTKKVDYSEVADWLKSQGVG